MITVMGKLFISFSPAVSDKAKKSIRQTIRQWRIHLWSGVSLSSIAKEINPVVRGWLNYYGKFGNWELRSSLRQIDYYLIRWAKAKYKSLRTPGANSAIYRANKSKDSLAFCALESRLCKVRLNGGSRINREVYVRFYERLRGVVPLVDSPVGGAG